MIVTLTRFSCECQWRRKQTESVWGGGDARLIKILISQKIPKLMTVTMVTLTLFYAGHMTSAFQFTPKSARS